MAPLDTRAARAASPPPTRARWGLLLVNLGTPDSTSVPDVRRYLDEFLSDPRVLDMSAIGRWLLLNLIILRTRPAKSAEAYEKIWTPEGSPLLVYSEQLAAGVQAILGDEVQVELAMRYQNPSLQRALDRFDQAGIDDVLVFPLFPQYASATNGSVVERVFDLVGTRWNTPELHVMPAFYDDPRFIEAFRAVARPVLDDFGPDRVLMSFHGLPERHVIKSDATGGKHCLASPSCCDAITHANRFCYRAQCYGTARALAGALELPPEQYVVSFQSRLGRTPWIQPYTDALLTSLPAQGVRRLAVLCPAFVADCLETLEEIGIRAREDFVAAGGEDLILVPSLNASEPWIRAVADMALSARDKP
jgi:ferrochelatase